MTSPEEIGSDFPLDSAACDADDGGAEAFLDGELESWARRTLHLPAPIALRSGRDALHAVCAALAAGGLERILLPSYLCASVLQGTAPLRPVFLPVGPDLAPRPEAVVGALSGPPAALLLQPLFGWPLPGPLREAARAAEASGTALVEDRTHALFGDLPLLSGRGAASTRKWGPLPDGGLAWGIPAPRGDARDPLGLASTRAAALRRKAAYLAGGDGDKEALYLGPLRAAEEALDAAPLPAGMSAQGRAALRALDVAAIRRRRRANHDALRAELDGLPLLPLLGPLPPGAVPLGLPVLFPDRATRDATRRALVARRVYCPVHWPLPPAVDPARFPDAADAAGRLLTLPCDQRYDERAMRRLAGHLREVCG